MKVNPLSTIPAVGLAVATMLPKSVRRRRVIGALVVTGAYAAQASLDNRDYVLVGMVPDAGQELAGWQRAINIAASSSYIGLLSVPAVAVARFVPIRRVFAAAALAGGYIACDAKIDEVVLAAKGKAQAAREQAARARDRVHHARESVAHSRGVWHQSAQTAQTAQ